MKIPWYYCIPLILIVILLTLYLCIKDTDCVTPPTAAETAASLAKWREENPSIRDTKIETPSPQIAQNPTPKKQDTTPTTKLPTTPKSVPEIKIPDISPALSSLTQRQYSVKQLQQYAEDMKKKQQFQLARLAHERIIDHAPDADDNARKNAATAIEKLLSKTPLWNPDAKVRKLFNIHITIHETHLDTAEKLKPEIENLIFLAADGMLTPDIKITSTTSPLSSISISEITSPIRFSIKKDNETRSKLYSGIYHAVRNQNNSAQQMINIPAPPKHLTPEQALKTYITRLAWVHASR